jgi:hypothetical protein
MVLQRPEIPLQPNAPKNDLRTCVIKRRSSSGTIGAHGHEARGGMRGLMKTCRKFSIPFFAYLVTGSASMGQISASRSFPNSSSFGPPKPQCSEPVREVAGCPDVRILDRAIHALGLVAGLEEGIFRPR